MADFCPVEGSELTVYPTSGLQTDDGLEDPSFVSGGHIQHGPHT